MRAVFWLLLLAWSALAQTEPPQPEPRNEDAELEAALGEAGSSQLEYARILERHLKRHPLTTKRQEIERVLLQAAIDLRDNGRILSYGVPVLESGVRNPLFLDHVTRVLLDDARDRDRNEKALKYARLLAEDLRSRLAPLESASAREAGRGRRLDETEYALSRAILFEARALGNLGKHAEAVEAARAAWKTCPSVEAAREIGKWLEQSGETEAAFHAYADAFTVIDARASQAERDDDRQRLARLAAKLNWNESAVGERVMAAWDRNRAVTAARRERLLAADPNAGATDLMSFVLSGPGGKRLELASLKGKVIVFDFWATWCGPCRAQYPLYQQVKERFKDNRDVVFLAVSTDENRDAVPRFLEANKWAKDVYFEDGLGAYLRINSIPMTMVVDRGGVPSSRLNGFIRDRFVDMLSERISEALDAN